MKEYLLGNVAIAKGLLEAGIGLVAGYPGTPSSEIIETLAALKGDLPFHVEWSVNEKVALEVAIGASWTGARAAATMKHVGLNVAADPFMTLAYLGVGGGIVVITADDPFCHSSQNEQDSRRYAQFGAIPCLDPAEPGEAKEMVTYGFELSERLNVPVMLRPTTRVSHARSDVEVGQVAEIHKGSGFYKNPARRVSLPVHVRPLHIELLEKQKRIEEALAGTPWNRLSLSGDHGVIASGISSLYAQEATLGDGSGPLLPEGGNLSSSKRHDPADGRACLQGHRGGRTRTCFGGAGREGGQKVQPGPGNSRQRIGAYPPLRRVGASRRQKRHCINGRAGIKIWTNSGRGPKCPAQRPPGLCPGCSHRATYYAMRKAFGKNAVFPSDIGCYTMAVPMGTVDTCLCMGASISLASGIRFGGEEKGICCSLGDSTFLHGGMTGLLNAAYNKARITVTILDNSTTAMTGHQPHPGTGFTATGEQNRASFSRGHRQVPGCRIRKDGKPLRS